MTVRVRLFYYYRVPHCVIAKRAETMGKETKASTFDREHFSVTTCSLDRRTSTVDHQSINQSLWLVLVGHGIIER